jgi:four helix bundle protein
MTRAKGYTSNTGEMVVFARTLDLIRWLVPQAEKFPKNQRFLVTHRLLGAAFDLQELLFDANAQKHAERLQYLTMADAQLSKIRLYLRLAREWQWLSSGQYEHVNRMVADIGKLLGGWIKQTKSVQDSN